MAGWTVCSFFRGTVRGVKWLIAFQRQIRSRACWPRVVAHSSILPELRRANASPIQGVLRVPLVNCEPVRFEVAVRLGPQRASRTREETTFLPIRPERAFPIFNESFPAN